MKIQQLRLSPGKYLLSPVDKLPKGVPQSNKSAAVGFASGENKTEILPRWKIIAAPEVGQRQNGVGFPALFREGETVLVMNRITQEDFEACQLLPGFENEKKVLIAEESVILAAIERE
jgi:hypothetical protein